jgi:hypothetical protein
VATTKESYRPQVVPAGELPPVARQWLDSEHRRIAQSLQNVAYTDQDVVFDGDVQISGDLVVDGSLTVNTSNSLFNQGILISGATLAALTLIDGDAASDEQALHIRQNGGTLNFYLTTDASPTSIVGAASGLRMTRTGQTPLTVALPNDNEELRFGTGGDDLAIYHDGTNNVLESNTGALVFGGAGTADYEFRDSGGTVVVSIEKNAASNRALIVGDDATTLSPLVAINSAAGAARSLLWRTAGVNRWILTCTSTAESGSDAGSAITWSARTDAGAAAYTLLEATRNVQQIGLVGGAPGASAPNWAFLSDLNTGIERVGADDIAIVQGGIRAFRGNATGVGFNGATPIAPPNYTVTNPSTDRAFDVSAAAIGEVRAVLGTLIADLISYGLLQ